MQTDEGIERARRIEAKMVQPDEDNMLAVCTYMTKVALDARIIDPEAEEYDGGKVALCAEKIIELISAAPPITEDNFRMTLDGRTYVERTKAGDELSALVTKYMMSDDYQEYKPREIGKLNDFKIVLMHRGALVSLSLKANGHYTCDYSMSGLGGVTRLCNLYERIPEQIHGLNAELDQAKKQLANAKEQYGKNSCFLRSPDRAVNPKNTAAR